MLKDKKLKETCLETLNKIVEYELAGVVRYTHYAFMIYGHHRIPIVNWLRSQATESLTHAQNAGEYITTLGGHPSLKIGPLLETHRHAIDDILKESLEHEKQQVEYYYNLLSLVEGKSVPLEEFARSMVAEEEQHIAEVEKMMRKSV